MSDLTQNIVVQPTDVNITVETNNITFTPTDVNLNIYSGGFAQVNGNIGELQYNNGGILGGVTNTYYDGNTLSLGSVTNFTISGGNANYVLTTDGSGNLSWTDPVAASANGLTATVANTHIYGGTNGYVLQTDGTGNLTWTAQTGGIPGNGNPGGANTQLQFNDAGNFGGIVGTTYDGANFTLGNISNVKLNGGNVGQYVITTGGGNLAYANAPSGTGWTVVANIAINDIFIGQLYGNLNGIAPGSNVNVSTTLNTANWTLANPNTMPVTLYNFVGGTDYIFGLGRQTVANTVSLARTQIGTEWTIKATPFVPTGVVQANNNVIIYESGSNRSAYSTDNGDNWTYANNINTTLNLGDSAYGNGTVIITRSEIGSNNFIKSTNYGLTWSNSNVGSNTYTFNSIAYGNGKFIATKNSFADARRSVDNGNTWQTINLGNAYLWRQFAYGNGRWVGTSEYTDASHRAVAVTSTDDGNTWTTTLLANTAWNSLTYANGIFIAADSYSGNVITSTDGITWSSNINTGTAGTGVGPWGSGIAYNDKNQLIVVGQNNNVAATLTPKITVTSSDGNISNSLPTPNDTYKNLGGAIGNVGAMWIRTA